MRDGYRIRVDHPAANAFCSSALSKVPPNGSRFFRHANLYRRSVDRFPGSTVRSTGFHRGFVFAHKHARNGFARSRERRDETAARGDVRCRCARRFSRGARVRRGRCHRRRRRSRKSESHAPAHPSPPPSQRYMIHTRLQFDDTSVSPVPRVPRIIVPRNGLTPICVG